MFAPVPKPRDAAREALRTQLPLGGGARPFRGQHRMIRDHGVDAPAARVCFPYRARGGGLSGREKALLGVHRRPRWRVPGLAGRGAMAEALIPARIVVDLLPSIAPALPRRLGKRVTGNAGRYQVTTPPPPLAS